jgi:hypothetical protein
MRSATMIFKSISIALATIAMCACDPYDPTTTTTPDQLDNKVEELASAIVPDSGSVGDPEAAHAALKDQAIRAKLHGFALRMASAHGVSAPATMRVVVGADKQAATKITSGSLVNDRGPVFVITMTGGPFTARRHPPGVPAPQGNAMILTIDAATHRLTHMGIVDAEPDLSQIGAAAMSLAE